MKRGDARKKLHQAQFSHKFLDLQKRCLPILLPLFTVGVAGGDLPGAVKVKVSFFLARGVDESATPRAPLVQVQDRRTNLNRFYVNKYSLKPSTQGRCGARAGGTQDSGVYVKRGALVKLKYPLV